MKRQALGKGLDALLPKARPTPSALLELELDQIRRNPYQPRVQFEADKLQELAASIRENGVLQPVIVRRVEDGYELVAGERRWRASQLAGLTRIPAIVQDVSDEKLLERALVENIQRDDLNALEEATAYQLLIDQFKLTQDELSRRVGKSRTAVTNTLRLLKLPQPIQQGLLAGEITMGHARALLPLSKPQQLALCRDIVKRGLSVRQVEHQAQRLLNPSPARPAAPDPNASAAARKLEQRWKTRVDIVRTGAAGRIVFHFASDDELERLYGELMGE
ncbi:MAG: ParB/RepB/Spo0J family partition protein [Acidobacteria bacterium]|nr:MAG: ParB/RepB/Spo0J family partition protein [Acidobacteriota bacterium]